MTNSFGLNSLDFIKKTNSFRKSCLIKNSFKTEIFSNKAFNETLFEISSKKNGDINLRIALDGGFNHKYALQMQAKPPAIDEVTSEWIKRIYGDREVSIILNNAEQYNELLTRELAN